VLDSMRLFASEVMPRFGQSALEIAPLNVAVSR
jgi:hypothetical protein